MLSTEKKSGFSQPELLFHEFLIKAVSGWLMACFVCSVVKGGGGGQLKHKHKINKHTIILTKKGMIFILKRDLVFYLIRYLQPQKCGNSTSTWKVVFSQKINKAFPLAVLVYSICFRPNTKNIKFTLGVAFTTQCMTNKYKKYLWLIVPVTKSTEHRCGLFRCLAKKSKSRCSSSASRGVPPSWHQGQAYLRQG